MAIFNRFDNRVEFGTNLEGLRNFGEGVEHPQTPPLGTPLVLCVLLSYMPLSELYKYGVPRENAVTENCRRQLEIAFYVFMLKICINVPSIKFQGNRSSESRADICGQTDMTKSRGAFHDYSNASESMRVAVSDGLASL